MLPSCLLQRMGHRGREAQSISNQGSASISEAQAPCLPNSQPCLCLAGCTEEEAGVYNRNPGELHCAIIPLVSTSVLTESFITLGGAYRKFLKIHLQGANSSSLEVS
jgi:hypothetical protein